MERKIDRQFTYNNYKRKKNSILFLLMIPAIIMLGSYLILYFGNVLNTLHLGTIYIPLLIGYIVLVFVLTPKLMYYKMQVNFLRLLIHEPELLKCNDQLFTRDWIEYLKKDGYELIQEDQSHTLLCKFHKKLPDITHSDQSLVFLVIANNKDFDFYGDEVDRGIQTCYMKHQGYEKVNKRMTLQYKKYDKIEDEAMSEVETMILYDAGRQVLVNLSFAYDNKNGLFSLNPGNWYPNRYVYFAFSESKRICDIKE